jgi:hypothetical protein
VERRREGGREKDAEVEVLKEIRNVVGGEQT